MRARTYTLDGDAELLAFAGEDGWLFDRDGVGLAARGVAGRVPVGEALSALRAVDGDHGAIALGALPFEPSLAVRGELVIPSAVLRRAPDGTCTVTVVGDGPDPELDVRRDRPAPDAFSLRPAPPHDAWCAVIERAIARIKDGELGKVVLAREVTVEANREIVVSQVLARLQALYPSCWVFSAEGFVGASPELLVSRRGDRVVTHPLAGTIPHSGDPDVDRRAAERMLASPKERAEHAFAVDDAAATLRPLCASLTVPAAPSIVALRNVAHLGTRIEGVLAPPTPSALDLALALHPTPAVGGTPTDAAVRYLRTAEGVDRGRYAGPVGWVDASGDGEFVVGIRSAEISGAVARLFAGVGIVEGSVPEEELAETQLKLQALLAAVVRP